MRPVCLPNRLLLTVAAALLFAGCGHDGVSPAEPRPPVLALYSGLAHGTGSDQDVLKGVLVRDGDCLYVEVGVLATPMDGSGTGPERVFPAFDASATFWDAARGRLVVGFRAIGHGDPVVFGGTSEDTAASGWVARPHAACDMSSRWFTTATLDPGSGSGYLVNNYGLNIREASTLERRIVQAGPFVAHLSVLAPGRFAGRWVEHEPQFRSVLRFTGSEAGLEEVLRLAADAPIPVEVRTGADHSLDDLRRALEELNARFHREAWYRRAHIRVEENAILIFADTDRLDRPLPAIAADLSREHRVRILLEPYR